MSYSDNKALYSKASHYYVTAHAGLNHAYKKSKNREARHNSEWEKRKVNINEIIDRFASDFTARENRQKMIFFGGKYNVIADMASGYLRIYDNALKTYVKLDGTPGTDKETHFKIKKREEM